MLNVLFISLTLAIDKILKDTISKIIIKEKMGNVRNK